jgi:hypothetical protein
MFRVEAFKLISAVSFDARYLLLKKTEFETVKTDPLSA